ncbi:MAG: hypothetical protein ACFFB0_12940 [Promethearchaeota archaeon]
MKNSRKTILILSFSIILIWSFFAPRTAAQEWTYDGADTEKIPDFSVYPSEWYVFNVTVSSIPPENYTIFEIEKGNYSDPYDVGSNGTSVFGKLWMVNDTSQEKYLLDSNFPFVQWNKSVGYFTSIMGIIPVEANGIVSEQILDNVSDFIEIGFAFFGFTFEHYAVYPDIYSFAHWNSSYNNAYFYANFTNDGITKSVNHNLGPSFYPNITLMSQPAQLPPEFSFTTEHDTLTVNSTEFKLKINVTDADNNNDGKVDTDYLYRIQNGTEWSNWTTIPNLLDWDLGDVEAGSYGITVEVKNMYGVTQKEITIEYEPPKKKPGIIPSYPIALISIIVLFSISIIIHKYRKKLIL